MGLEAHADDAASGVHPGQAALQCPRERQHRRYAEGSHGCCSCGVLLVWRLATNRLCRNVQQRPFACLGRLILPRRMQLYGLDAWVQPEQSARLQ